MRASFKSGVVCIFGYRQKDRDGEGPLTQSSAGCPALDVAAAEVELLLNIGREFPSQPRVVKMRREGRGPSSSPTWRTAVNGKECSGK